MRFDRFILVFVLAVFAIVVIGNSASAAVDEMTKVNTGGKNDPNIPSLFTRTGRPKTFVDRQTREALEAIEIVDRPNRPLHFYGNTVRRRAGSAGNSGGGNSGGLRR